MLVQASLVGVSLDFIKFTLAGVFFFFQTFYHVIILIQYLPNCTKPIRMLNKVNSLVK